MAGFAGTSPNGAGAMLRLIRDGCACTHSELVELTGLSRSTVAQRVDALLTQQLVVPAEPGASRGGRPPRTFTFNRAAGVVLAADLGDTHSRVAVTDLAGDVLAGDARGHRDRRRVRRSCWPGPRVRSDGLLEQSGPHPLTTSVVSGSAFRGRSSSRPVRRWRRRSCRAGTATASRRGCVSATGSRCWSITTSTSWRSASTGRAGAIRHTCCL